ncbi:MAG: transposase, partial [Caldilineaceae bacterium]
MPLFHVHDDYIAALTKMQKYVLQFSLTLIAYCLMPNHYHFLIRQDAAFRAGLLAQRVFNSYSKRYNLRYNHSGTLFENNYKVKLVDKPEYLHHLCRYIHANPVKGGLVRRPEDWIYSNYQEWMGLRN